MIYSIVSLLAIFLVFAALHDLTSYGGDLSLSTNLDGVLGSLPQAVIPIVAATLGLQIVLYGWIEISLGEVLLRATMKALLYLSLYNVVSRIIYHWDLRINANHQVRFTSWMVVPSIWAFSILSGLGSAARSSSLHAITCAAFSLLPLGHVIHSLPPSAPFRSKLWFSGLLPLIVVFVKEKSIVQTNMSYASYLSSGLEHPIEQLTRDAESHFARAIQVQSRTYPDAHTEYVRRYKMNPPPGFDTWFKFATLHGSPIIDDFDVIHKTLKPFFSLSGQEIVALMVEARITLGNDLWHCTLSSEMAKSQCSHPHRLFDRHISESFDRLLADKRAEIPLVNFLVNHLDEPAVLIPPDLHAPRSVNWTDMSLQPVWDTITKHCYGSNDNSQPPGSSNVISALNFIRNTSSSYDLCQHPEYSNENGFLVSPTSAHLVEAPVPIFSTGSFSTMGDVLFPSPAYSESEFLYDLTFDMNWEKKSSNLYWAGSTTGGYAVGSNWRRFQRQRLATLAQDLETTPHRYLRVENGVLTPIDSKFLNTRLYDISLTRLNQCQNQACSEQNAFFRKSGWANRNRGLQSRLVMDIDGNGISGRFYKLLASKSCPLKQTLLREWHDDRLVPWVHYVPVSLGLQELAELVSYLTLSKPGQERAKQIALEGQKWHSTALREVDRSIYLYRLILEIARLQDPSRAAIKH